MNVSSPQHFAGRRPIQRIAFWQLFALAVLISVVWLNEVLDWPAFFFGLPPTPPDWVSACILTAAVFFATLIMAVPLYIQKRIASHKAVTICSYCRRVQTEPQAWEHTESFFTNRTFAIVSHGVCPECSAKVMRDYRNGRQNAGARETIVSEMVV